MTRFAPGDAVRVRALGKTGHVRVPHYIRLQAGEVIQYCGCYLNPEELAIGRRDGAPVDLYRVSFRQSLLWPDEGHPSEDRLVLEVYDHWLDAAGVSDAA